MGLDIYLCKNFRTTHEREFFDEFAKNLLDNWKSGDAALLGNVDINGNELDCLLIKNDSITIIDFKNYGGDINFYENGPWYTKNNTEIRGGSKTNPFYQIKFYKESTINFFNRHKNIFKNNEPNFLHISGVVVFHKPIIVNNDIPAKINTWFKITSLQDSFNVLKNFTSKEINISKSEMQSIVKLIGYEEKIEFEIKENKKTLIEENLKKIFRYIYILKVKKEFLARIDFKEDFESVYVKTTIKGVQEIKDKKAKCEIFLKSENELLNNSLNEHFVSVKEIIEKYKITKIDLETISNFNSFKLFDFIKENINNEFSLKNDLDFSNEIILFYSNIIRNSFKYSSKNIETFFNAVFYSYNSQEFIKSLFSLRFYLNSIFSNDLIDRDLKGYSGFNEDYIIRFIYTFDESCNHYFEKCNFEVMTSPKSRFLRYFKSFTVPLPIKEFNKIIISHLSSIFKNDNILFAFLQSLGLSFLYKDQIYTSDIYLVNDDNSVNKSVFNLNEHSTYLNTPFLLNSPTDAKLQLLFKESLQLLLYPKNKIEWGISEDLLNGSSIINNSLNNILSQWENYKLLFRSYTAQNVNMEYCKMSTKYYQSGYHQKIVLAAFVCNNISRLNSYSNNTEFVYKTPISKRFYDIMFNKYVKEPEARFIDKILAKKIASTSINKTIEDAIKKVMPSNPTSYLKGYDDVKEYISQHLQVFINPEIKKIMYVNNPEGILLYGPPGCGKTYFAKWISDYLGFKFIEVPRSSFGSPYVDGAMKELIKIINDLKKDKKQVIFFDEFDSVAIDRKNSNVHNESIKVVNTLLQEIPKITESGNLIIAATNYISKLDDAVIRSGRFSLKIPIFPPSPHERPDILKYHLFKRFPSDSPLLKMLIFKEAINDPFWQKFTQDLLLYSNSDLELLSGKISTFLYNIYTNEKTLNLDDFESLKKHIIIRCENYIDFFLEVQQNYSEIFEERMNALYNEMVLKGCIKSDKQNERMPIGYRILNNDKNV